MLHRAEVLAAGTVVGDRFRLERIVGEGGMGVVWAARDLADQRAVALKFLHDTRPGNDLRFQREGRAAMAVRHPNVAPVYAMLHTAAGVPFLVMDLLQGESLRRRLRRQGVLGLAECAQILLPVIDAVRAAHAAGIVHRDLKPENVFLAPHAVLVLDFGIAKLLAADGVDPTSITASGALLGTPVYMAPEQIFSERDIDGRADVWALGVMLYECLAGVRPTEGAGIGQVLKIITSENIPHLCSHVAALGDLGNCVMAMLSRRREQRPTLDVVAALLAHHASQPAGAQPRVASMAPTLDTSPSRSTPMGVVAGAPPAPSRSGTIVWIALAAAVGIAAGAVAVGRLVAHIRPSSAPVASSIAIQPAASSAPTAVLEATVTATATATTTASTPTRIASTPVFTKPSPVASASSAIAWTFDLSMGKQGGFETAGALRGIRAAMPATKPCFAPPSEDAFWTVDLLFEWPKSGGRRIDARGRKNHTPDLGPEGTKVAACVKAKLEDAHIPDAIPDPDGGASAYLIVGIGWFRD